MKPIYFFLLAALVTVPATTYAQNFLVGIPGVTQGESGSFDAYIQAIYVMFISIAALLAVVKIIIAGLKYMFTDIVTQKGDAKKDIQGAVLGLIIVLAAVLILTIINPELTQFDFESNQVELPDPIRQPPPVPQVNSTDGYTFIPRTSSVADRQAFVASCAGRPVQIGDEVRCYALDGEIEENITNDLTNSPNQIDSSEVQEALDQARDFLGVRFITDTDAIQVDLEVNDVLFAIDVTPGEGIVAAQAAGVCEVYAKANGEIWDEGVSSYGAGSNVQLVTSDNYAACVVID